ncbi:MAG: metallophosphoesterase [Chloroflexi bacterium]|jgi:hypothetical protein|nr:metallophosphoesterase [Chloroflexota bacterium]
MPLSAFSSQPITRAGAVRAFGAASAAAILAPGVVGAADIEIVPIIGCPTDRSAVLHVHVGRESEVRVDLPGATSGTPQLGAPAIARPGYPASIMIDGLEAGTRTPYQVWFRNDATGSDFIPGPSGSIQSARQSGESFTFTVQGDSHPERQGKQFDPDLYRRTLLTVGADRPDFHVMLGDDFSVDALKVVNASTVAGRYAVQVPYLGLIAHSVPLVLVNGNHEQAARYLLDGTPDNVAVWAQVARNRAFPQPVPDHFYTGNSEVVPHVGLLRNYAAWTWGDALFVTLDPYWGSTVPVDNVFQGSTKRADQWDITLGEDQYRWFRDTLEGSQARWKFVFAHHVNGTGRGGASICGRYEWGGRSARGAWEFDQKRPGWGRTIHQVMAASGVTAFFQGHDHLYAREEVDGVIYQTVPEPADPTATLWNDDAYPGAVIHPNSGYLRVHVTLDRVRVEYVKSFLAPHESPPAREHGMVAHAYDLALRAAPSPAAARDG